MARTSKPSMPFDKYHYYLNSVQSPQAEVDFFLKVYKKKNDRLPEILREDFCGAFDICAHWVKKNKSFHAIGVDLAEEPLAYGKAHTLKLLKPLEIERLSILQKNVLTPGLPSADVICALNFSYFIFKKRQDLKAYFSNVFQSLNARGVLILDCFGGSNCFEPNEEETYYTDLKFTYFWDQASFDPVTNHALFYIHYKRRNEKKREKVFTYDWRLWSIPELRDVLEEVGFKDVGVFWEGTTPKGEGNGIFKERQSGEACESWIAYIVASA